MTPKDIPAFPCEAPDVELRDALLALRDKAGFSLQDIKRLSSKHSGMSLRDWFAGQALCGALASCPEGIRHAKSTKLPYKEWAESAYLMADAMLAEREKNAAV